MIPDAAIDRPTGNGATARRIAAAVEAAGRNAVVVEASEIAGRGAARSWTEQHNVGVAIALGESLEPIKLLGCSIGIGGVLLYSLVK